MGRPRKTATRATHGRGGRSMRNASRLSMRKKSKPKPAAESKQKQGKQQQQGRSVIPFHASDRILLVGEGDFSFSASLAAHHGCQRLVATCYDSEEDLHRKYPQAGRNIAKLIASSGKSLDVSTTSKSDSSAAGIKRKRDDDEDGNERELGGTAATRTATGSSNGKQEEENQGNRAQFPKVLFSVDARKLGASGGGGKVVRKGIPRSSAGASSAAPGRGASIAGKEQHKEAPGGGPWDVICFNFPHVGGLSTDVNRQVRANQELLVSFFKASVPLLSAPLPPAEDLPSDDDDDEWEGEGYEAEDGNGQSDFEDDQSGSDEKRSIDKSRRKVRQVGREPGQIVVTLFEGEPYTLWNIRDLARHAGLRVVTSFKFPWASYPGYSHARTLGEIESKHGGRGGWKGEDREARSYVFERKDHESLGPKGSQKRGGSDDDADDE